MSLANRITIARILLIPLFILLLAYYIDEAHQGRVVSSLRHAALIVFVIASVSDALDGFIARRFGQTTHLGRVLDPIADKLLVASAIILLSVWHAPGLHRFPIWYPIVIFSRDVMLLIGSIVLHVLCGHVHVQPDITGKASTAFNLIAVIAAILHSPLMPFSAIVWIAGTVTAYSAVLYFLDGLRQLHRAAEKSQS